jgi:hypothetical protein
VEDRLKRVPPAAPLWAKKVGCFLDYVGHYECGFSVQKALFPPDIVKSRRCNEYVDCSTGVRKEGNGNGTPLGLQN